ncbi:MAG TPA: PIG-L family deacetylase [Opitutaceae bacterium]|nr:PIG-L family deacetylase [Opitutaceae bacterium]
MKLSRADADAFVPAGGDPAAALARVTHLCVAAHQDDIEIMAHAGICDCLEQPGKAFGGVVVTNGAGSPRSGRYAAFTDEQMLAARREEQRRAASLGRYAVQLQLAHPSADVKRPGHAGVAADLAAVFGGCSPEVVYLHNPADKHDTHVAVLARCLEALRSLPPDRRPRRVLGCEVWRDLDWLVDADKVSLDAGRRPELAQELLRAFDSQVAGGKRYDLAVAGRRAAHATFHTSHATDQSGGITWALDLTPLLAEPAPDLAAFTLAAIDRLRDDVKNRIARVS